MINRPQLVGEEKRVVKSKKKKKSHVPLRMNLLFVTVFVTFAILILRLGVVQIVEGEDAVRRLELTEDVIVSTPSPRGQIYDRKGRLVVGNESLEAITYTLPRNHNPKDILKTAKDLSKIMEIDIDKITHRDMVDYWIVKNPDEAKAKLTDEEWQAFNENKKEKEAYKLQRERVTEEDLASLTEEDMKVLAIYREFTKGYALDLQIVKNEEVTPEEYAIVSENLNNLPNVDTMTDWKRTYPYEDTLRSILGNISDGLPEDRLEYYQSRDYSRTDRVGRSFIELQYEDVLHGKKEKTKNIIKNGEVVGTELVQEGAPGNDLVLSIDMELQKAIDKIIEEELRNGKRHGGSRFLDRAFVVLMDPFTGEILALSGKQYVYDEEEGKHVFRDFAAGTFNTSYVPGSAVKGATVLAGYMSGAIQVGQSLYDEPLYLPPNGKKSSVFNRGGNNQWISDNMALTRSSNVFMYKVAIGMGDGKYRRNYLAINKDKAFNELRYYYNQFGLGVRTGIDLPGEQVGYLGDISKAKGGHALDFAIGQFDSYTPLQLAQYVSTIANGGYRVQPRVVKEIREPNYGQDQNELGTVVHEFQPNILNRIDATDREIKQVQQAFWNVFHHPRGTGYRHYAGQPYRAAGKTGTSETYEQKVKVWNVGLVAYAPYDKPEVAMSVMVPAAYVDGYDGNPVNHAIGKRVLKTYFDMKNGKGSTETED